MRRRRFITALVGTAAWPLAAHPQQPERVRHIGVLLPFPENDSLTRAIVTAFREALSRFGWIEGKNIRIDYRFAAGDPALFKTYAADLVALSPDVVLASTPQAVAPVRQQTRTVPIVFVLAIDPVGLGFVQSLARPGGNITGFGAVDPPIMGKWLQLLREIAPSVTRIAVIFNPESQPYAAYFYNAIEAAAPSFRMTITLAPVHDEAGIEETIATQAREPGGGLISLPDPFIASHREVIIAAAARNGLPLIGPGEIFPKAGALMTYWYDPVDAHAQAASYIDQILRGANPGDLPVQYPTKYSLIINLKTAKALGLIVPPNLLDLADEVIE
jgi:putative tryptophan/tyrosine transport system substrate-binding protein